MQGPYNVPRTMAFKTCPPRSIGFPRQCPACVFPWPHLHGRVLLSHGLIIHACFTQTPVSAHLGCVVRAGPKPAFLPPVSASFSYSTRLEYPPEFYAGLKVPATGGVHVALAFKGSCTYPSGAGRHHHVLGQLSNDPGHRRC